MGIGDDSNIAPILRRRADHGRAADVDVLDRFFESDSIFSDRRFERIEVDDYHVDGLNIVFVHRRDVVRIVPESEKRPVDFRMESFHTAVHHLGKSGYFGYVGDP